MSVLFCKCVFCTGEEHVVCTDYVYCVSCSVQYTLSFEDVLFDLFACRHVGMLIFILECVCNVECLLVVFGK